LGGTTSVTDLYNSLQGYRVRGSERVAERERRPVRHWQIMLIR